MTEYSSGGTPRCVQDQSIFEPSQTFVTISPWIRWLLGGLMAAVMFTFGILRNHENRIGANEQQLTDHKESQKQSDQDTKDRLSRIEANQLRLIEMMGQRGR